MEPTDFGAFETAFRRLSSAFSAKKVKPADSAERCQTYFRVLEPFPLTAVLAAASTLLETSKRMPPAADWRAAIKLNGTPVVQPSGLRQMTVTEAQALAQAAARGYSAPACTCDACQRAGVSDQLLRFVPTLVGETEERAFNPLRNKVEICGHWAHGEELRRWYAAREACLRALPPRLRQLVSREPGEEG